MQFKDFRRPFGDTALSMHYCAAAAQGEINWMVELYARKAREINCRWFMGLDFSTSATQGLIAMGLEPIDRVFVQPSGDNDCLGGYLDKYQQFINGLGRWCKAPWNEVNNSMEYGRWPDPWSLAERWVRWANAIIAMGGYPSTPTMSPGGEYRDLDFLPIFITRVNEIDRPVWKKGAWVSVHNYPLNHPLDYSADQCGYLHYRWINALYLELTGVQMPVLSTEGGPIIGNGDDGSFPRIDKWIHADMCKGIALAPVEPWLFVKTSFWLEENDYGNPVWGGHAYYSFGEPVLYESVHALATTTPAPIQQEEEPVIPLNYSPGRTAPIRRVIIHHTGSLASAEATKQYFEGTRGTAEPVSANFIVNRDGSIVPYVRVQDTAWHAAGANEDSIGIENVGNGNELPYTPEQYQAIVNILHLCRTTAPPDLWQVSFDSQHVIGHSVVTPGKVDPGSLFDWPYLLTKLNEEDEMPVPNEYLQYGQTWPEVTSTLKGICDVALETLRKTKVAFKDVDVKLDEAIANIPNW